MTYVSASMQDSIVMAAAALVMDELQSCDIFFFLSPLILLCFWGPEKLTRVGAISLSLGHFQSLTGDTIHIDRSCPLE